jgi:hypothetical protein
MSEDVSKRFSNHSHVFKLELHTLTTLDSSLVPAPESLMMEFELQQYRKDCVQFYVNLVQPLGMVPQNSVCFVKSVPVTLCGCHDGRDGVIVGDYRHFRSIHIVVVVVPVEVKSLERPFEGSYRCSGISRSKGLRNGRVACILCGGRS